MLPHARLSNIYSPAKPFVNAGDGSAADAVTLPSVQSPAPLPYPYSEVGYTARDAVREREEEEARYRRDRQGQCTDQDLGLVQERAKAAALKAGAPLAPVVCSAGGMEEGCPAVGEGAAGADMQGDPVPTTAARTTIAAAHKPVPVQTTATAADESALAAFIVSLGPHEAALKGKGVELKHLKAYCKLIAKCPVTGAKGVLVERVLAHMAKGR